MTDPIDKELEILWERQRERGVTSKFKPIALNIELAIAGGTEDQWEQRHYYISFVFWSSCFKQ